MSIFGPIQYETIAGFPLRKLGSLKQLEAEWFERQGKERIKGLLPYYQLAEKICKETGMSDEEVLELLDDLNSAESKVKLSAYGAAIQEILDSQISEEQFKREIALLMLNSRVSPPFIAQHSEEINEHYPGAIKDGRFVNLSEFPATVINQIRDFAIREKNGDVTPEQTNQSLGE